VLRKFLVPNPAIKGFRVMLDVEVSDTDTTVMTCFLQTGRRRLTETWNYTWKIYNL
jgi:glucans biosynthesis protein